ncbi:hypothetical protein [Nocardioides bruguierae]|uniref:Fibronectin type-III domain-containing protein n=1 Tax=Nocardioides bruguierae TaxID=2945102 RepID=A0A9X2DBW3_9ACTN|nr:hypothetical protein [Nocardioides bruguierae]MCM0622517.1 hypothetical protein [Nocardioides bruguierae]
MSAQSIDPDTTGLGAAIGTVTDVSSRTVGSTVTLAAQAGTSTLQLDDNVDISAGDEVVLIPAGETTGTIYVVADVDEDTHVTLATPLDAYVYDGDFLATYPVQTETVAMVQLADTGDVTACVVLHSLGDAIGLGLRDAETAETVLTIVVAGVRYVFDIVSRPTVRDLTDAEPGAGPAGPGAPVLATSTYVAPGGRNLATIDASWDEVAYDTDGLPLSAALDRYELQTLDVTNSGSWTTVAQVPAGTTEASLNGYAPGSQWQVRLRAVDVRQRVSPWSPATAITATADTTPPPAPTAPAVSARLGTIVVTWDGQATTGPMPSDFSHVELHMSATPDFTATAHDPATLVGNLYAAGSTAVAGQPYGQYRYFRLLALDTSGNVSTASAQGATVTQALVDTDVIGEVIDGANIVDGSLNAADKIVGNTIVGALIQALAIQAGHLAANAVTADKIDVGSLYGLLVTGLQIQTNEEPTVGLKLTDSGLIGYGPSGTPTFEYDAATGQVTVSGELTSGSTITGATVTGSLVQTHSAANQGIKLKTDGTLIGYHPTYGTMFKLTSDYSGHVFFGDVDVPTGDLGVGGETSTTALVVGQGTRLEVLTVQAGILNLDGNGEATVDTGIVVSSSQVFRAFFQSRNNGALRHFNTVNEYVSNGRAFVDVRVRNDDGSAAANASSIGYSLLLIG